MRMRRSFTLALAAMAAAATWPLQAQSSAPFTVAETGEAFGSLQDAVEAIGRGSGTIRIAPGPLRRMRGPGSGPGRLSSPSSAARRCSTAAPARARRRSCSAAGRARVDGLVFTGVRVPDGNGAGIRLEDGDLAVSYTLFSDGQNGILTANGPPGSISIDHSTFSGLGERRRHPFALCRPLRQPQGHQFPLRARRRRPLSQEPRAADRGAGQQLRRQPGPPDQLSDRPVQRRRRPDRRQRLRPRHRQGELRDDDLGRARKAPRTAPAGLVIEDNDASVAPGFRWSTAFVGDWSGERLEIRDNRLGPRIGLFARR